jgi:hypothetical protein
MYFLSATTFDLQLIHRQGSLLPKEGGGVNRNGNEGRGGDRRNNTCLEKKLVSFFFAIDVVFDQ